MSLCLSGISCKNTKEDIRPPLINRVDFTNFIPVLVTNEFNKGDYDARFLQIQKK